MAEETAGTRKLAETPEGSAAEQHPALAGDPAAEVAARSADGSEGTTFAKTFVVASPAGIPKDHPMHEHNSTRVLEEAIQRGLHPKGEAKLVKTEKVDEDRRGVVSTACTYSVDVEPAVIDDKAHETVTPSSAIREAQSSRRAQRAKKSPDESAAGQPAI